MVTWWRVTAEPIQLANTSFCCLWSVPPAPPPRRRRGWGHQVVLPLQRMCLFLLPQGWPPDTLTTRHNVASFTGRVERLPG